MNTTTDLLQCALSDCIKVIQPQDAIWDEEDDEAYCSLEHHSEARYECTTCPEAFANFPAANNHELSTDYQHLTVALEGL